MQRGGKYPGDIVSILEADLEAHLRGDEAFAFCVVQDALARFACIDIDENFASRIHVLRDAIHAVGGDALLDASFATTGSDDGRGKIVITLVEPTDASWIRRIVAAVRNHAVNDQRFGTITPDTMTTFPQERSGGIVRVLGRHIGRDGSLETALSLNGEVIDLRSVIAIDANCIGAIVESWRAKRSPTRAAWADALLTKPWMRGECGGNGGAFRRLVALARETIRLHGDADEGRRVFESWLDDVRKNSADFQRPSDKNKDRRNPLTWDRGGSSAWRIACANPTTFRPRVVDQIASREQRRLYVGLADYVIANGLNATCFGLDFERIRELADIDDKRHARRAMRTLVKRGLVDVVDRGASRERGQRGLISLWAIVGDGESVETVRTRREADGRSSQRMKRRAQEHAEREGRLGVSKIEL